MSVDVRADARRAQLAESALTTLSEMGYARTSVRDIAQNSPFSHGVLHYYFKDKTEIILEAIRLYKTQCIARWDDALRAESADELLMKLAAVLTDGIHEEGQLHRLWYDVRSEGMVDPAFRDLVWEVELEVQAMVVRVIEHMGALSGTRLLISPETAAVTLDALFQRALLEHYCGDPTAADTLMARVLEVWPHILG